MNSLIKIAGRTVIAATLLSASLSAFAQDSSPRFLASKAPKSIPVTSISEPAAYPESWSARVQLVRHPKLAPGQGEGNADGPVIGQKAEIAARLVRH